MAHRAGRQGFLRIAVNRRSRPVAKGATVYQQCFSDRRRLVHFLNRLRKTFADIQQVRNTVQRGGGLHVRGLRQVIATIERFVTVGERQHLRHIAACGIPQHANTRRVYTVFRGMFAQIANGGFTIDNRGRKGVGNRTVFRRRDDESRRRQRHTHLDKLIPGRAGETAAGEIDDCRFQIAVTRYQ